MLNSSKHTKGGIDFISPAQISGWVYSNKISYDKVKFFINKELISCSIINEIRKDVTSSLGVECSPGFTIKLPQKFNKVVKSKDILILAYSSNELYKHTLKLIKNPNLTYKKLEKLMNSNFLGLNGHFDGMTSNGLLHGWAAKPNQHSSATVWLHSKKNEPISILCNHDHGGITQKNIPRNCGFILDTHYLDKKWLEQEVWFTFDKEGQYELPKLQPTMIKEKNIANQEENLELSDTITEEDQFIEKYKNIDKLQEEIEIINATLKNIELFEENFRKKGLIYRIKTLFKKSNN